MRQAGGVAFGGRGVARWDCGGRAHLGAGPWGRGEMRKDRTEAGRARQEDGVASAVESAPWNGGGGAAEAVSAGP